MDLIYVSHAICGCLVSALFAIDDAEWFRVERDAGHAIRQRELGPEGIGGEPCPEHRAQRERDGAIS